MAESVDGKVTLLWPWHSMQVEQTTSPNRAGARVGVSTLVPLFCCGDTVLAAVGLAVGGVLGQPNSGELPNTTGFAMFTAVLSETTQFRLWQFMKAPSLTTATEAGMYSEVSALQPLNADW